MNGVKTLHIGNLENKNLFVKMLIWIKEPTQSGRCLPGPGGDGGQPQIRAGLGRPVSPGSGTYRVRAGAACKLYETV